jgi:hypothetical protein
MDDAMTKKNYRRERQRIIRDAIYNLLLFMTIPKMNLERIPYENLQQLEQNISGMLDLVKDSHRDMSEWCVSENPHLHSKKTCQRNTDSQELEKSD